MLVLKIAAIVVLSGIGIGFLSLAASSGGGDDVAVTNPAVPTITDADGAGPTSEPIPVPRPAQTIAAPAVGAQTAVIAPKPKPKPKPIARPDKPGRDIRTAKVNRPCQREGAVAFTKRLEPLMCRNGRWDLLL